MVSGIVTNNCCSDSKGTESSESSQEINFLGSYRFLVHVARQFLNHINIQ